MFRSVKSLPLDWRPWLILGRLSNLPTVWSNCLAAWLMGGGGSGARFAALCLGAGCIYVGGMFLNDACDADFDRVHRTERPIPAGTVSRRAVTWAGLGSLLLGWLLLAGLGRAPMQLGGMLVATVLIYDVVHKRTPLAPLLMAACRYLLFLAAGSAASDGVVGETVWSALALAGYVVGLSYVARHEATGGWERWWPLLALALPLVLAGFVNPPHTWGRTVVLMPVVLFVLWTGRALMLLLQGGPESGKACVSHLLAGIVLVDILALMPAPNPWGLVFLGFFGLALILQKSIPAT